MKEILYHGSEKIIEVPEYGKGTTNNDYGRGFYCTKNIELAKEWACGKGNNGYANSYELELDGLKILDLNQEPYTILNWLAVLTKHRSYWQNSSISENAKRYLQENFYVDLNGYDVVRGYRADDSYFSFAQDFVSGLISYKTLSRAMRLGELGEQTVLISQKAFSQIKYTGNVEANPEIYFQKKTDRDKRARKAYRLEKTEQNELEDLFMLDIMREGIKNGDNRLR